ncbi:hypothetical protein [Pseudomonas psychrophila]|uniref:Uncharacterized protein n=1 Tax=Pseudomonas psychrophila TaxID=122355 RepID=A0A8I1FYE5_9PSED|nr:hypothetical protein [Pseudomonas psychrophila]AVX93264.1 hypothetical protein PkP19E3_34585 [Pseudomonas koreensis]MBJ2259181.1 hypothetical protein [Pseudomonas psychrophila]
MRSNRTISDVPLVLLETIESTWRQAREFTAITNTAIEDGLVQLRAILSTPMVLCRGCLKETCDPDHFDEAGKCVREQVPALIAENDDLKARTAKWCEYGDEHQTHTFFGDAEAIWVLGELIFELEELRQDAKRPWWLRMLPSRVKTIPVAAARLTNTSSQAHCPHCAVCHMAEETCIEALRRILSVYERTEHGSKGVKPCA